MGCCASSTQYQTDPITGQVMEKKKLGGAYPGQRRPQHAPYTPGDNDFDKTGQAVVHFKAYGGGNALTLVKQDGSSQPQSGGPEFGKPGGSQYVQVTLPEGVSPGQEIHVQAPDGKVNAIVVPPGFGPGSTFTVEFTDELSPPPPSAPTQSAYVPPQAKAEVYNPSDNNANSFNYNFDNSPVAQAQPINNQTNSNYDDGFASGFGKRN